MMNLKIIISLCLLICALLLLANCQRDTTTTTSSSKPRIALVMKSLANEFFQTMENGAKMHQRENAAKYDLLANGIKDELDVGRQVELMEQMIAQRVDAIVIAPADSKALVAVCKKRRTPASL
ncbi:MAG: substrate-binding domain-containing protein [Pyrinomonadaceae bacterium]